MPARADQRGFVAVDYQGEVNSVAKWAAIKTKNVGVRLTDKDTLPCVDDARAAMNPALSKNQKKTY